MERIFCAPINESYARIEAFSGTSTLIWTIRNGTLCSSYSFSNKCFPLCFFVSYAL